MGLLLVTKLLPAGDEATIRQVYQAVGPTFLARLLLPLKTSLAAAAPAGVDAEAAQRDAATSALGLAVLSSFARVPELAASEDLLEKMPLLLNVVRAGGIAPLLAARQQPAAAAPLPSDAAADAAAVQDALECAVAAARSGAEGRAVAAQSGALGAAAAALRACPPGATQQLSLALQLLAAILAGEGRAEAFPGENMPPIYWPACCLLCQTAWLQRVPLRILNGLLVRPTVFVQATTPLCCSSCCQPWHECLPCLPSSLSLPPAAAVPARASTCSSACWRCIG